MAQDDLTKPADEGTGVLWLPLGLPALHASAVNDDEFLALIIEAMTAPITDDEPHGWCRIGGTGPAPGVS